MRAAAIAGVGLFIGGCHAPIARDVAGDVPFLDWPAADTLLVGSASGLFVIDVPTGEIATISPEPVIDASLDGDGRALFVPSTIDPATGVMCLACASELIRADLDGGSAEVVASDLNGNVDTTFVQSPNRRFLAWSAGIGVVVRDDVTGEAADSDAYVRTEDVADDGATAVVAWKSAAADLPRYGLWHADGSVDPIEFADGDDGISRFRAYDGGHHGLRIDHPDADSAEVSVETVDAGDAEWTLPVEAPIRALSVSWSLDGRFITFITNRHAGALHLVDGITGADRVVADVHLGGGSWNGATAASPDGTQVAWIADGDVYVLDL